MKGASKEVPCLPVATLAAPRSMDVQPIGFVAASGEWGVTDFAAMTHDLAMKLAAKAKVEFPTATALYNFRWTKGRGHHGHEWHDGTADVYGETGNTHGGGT